MPTCHPYRFKHELQLKKKGVNSFRQFLNHYILKMVKVLAARKTGYLWRVKNKKSLDYDINILRCKTLYFLIASSVEKADLA